MTKEIALRFCWVCNRAYEAWVTHKYLFDQNDKKTGPFKKATWFTDRLSTITQEYALQQIAKLHDPAGQEPNQNASVDFVVKFGEWGTKEAEIKAIEARLLPLSGYLKAARNKILAHNDLMTLQAGKPLGAFPKDEDDLYFATLQELVNEVHVRWVDGGPYPFNDLAIADVCEFLDGLERSQ